MNVESEVIVLVKPLPESVPELDQGPPAVQLVAFVEDQVKVDLPPEVTEDGETESEAVGSLDVMLNE